MGGGRLPRARPRARPGLSRGDPRGTARRRRRRFPGSRRRIPTRPGLAAARAVSLSPAGARDARAAAAATPAMEVPSHRPLGEGSTAAGGEFPAGELRRKARRPPPLLAPRTPNPRRRPTASRRGTPGACRTISPSRRARRILFDAWRYERRARRAGDLAGALLAAVARAGGATRRAGYRDRGRPCAADRPSILVVSPYPIYPTVSGGSVRIWNLLRGAAQEFDLHVAVFSTTLDDADQRSALAQFCRSVHFLRREDAPPTKPSSLLPRGAEYFAFDAARRRLRDLAESVDARVVQLEHTELGQFAGLFPGRKVTLTELDLSFVTAARRRALGFGRRFAVDRLLWSDLVGYRRLLRYEIRSAERCDQVHVMSEADGETLGRYLHDGVRRLRVVDNGVDCARFRPRAGGEAPDHDVLFVGSFGHSPNRDAIEWLLAGDLAAAAAAAAARAAGDRRGPSARGRSLARHGRDGIEVFGTVADTAAFYRGARVLLAPIRAGSGTRLKLLEAFASALPVVGTRLAAEGLAVRDGEHLLTAETGRRAGAGDGQGARGARARRRRSERRHVALAEERYDWQQCAEKLMSAWDELLGEPAGAGDRCPRRGGGSRSAAGGGAAGACRRSVRRRAGTARRGRGVGDPPDPQRRRAPRPGAARDLPPADRRALRGDLRRFGFGRCRPRPDARLSGAHRADPARELQPRPDPRSRSRCRARASAGLPQPGRRAGRPALAPPDLGAAPATGTLRGRPGWHPRTAGARAGLLLALRRLALLLHQRVRGLDRRPRWHRFLDGQRGVAPNGLGVGAVRLGADPRGQEVAGRGRGARARDRRPARGGRAALAHLRPA